MRLSFFAAAAAAAVTSAARPCGMCLRFATLTALHSCCGCVWWEWAEAEAEAEQDGVKVFVGSSNDSVRDCCVAWRGPCKQCGGGLSTHVTVHITAIEQHALQSEWEREIKRSCCHSFSFEICFTSLSCAIKKII